VSAPPDEDRIEREVWLPAPIDAVWAALTEPERLSAWFGTSALADVWRLRAYLAQSGSSDVARPSVG
jgi:uncharacterized protein YndB with AHSA1/START domain